MLKNSNGEELKDTFVLSRLKKVSNELKESDLYEKLEVEQILKHKKKGNKVVYLVKY